MSSLTKIWWDSKQPIYNISQTRLQAEGIKFILLDVDGTLINRNTLIIPETVKEWIFKSKEYFYLFLISNNPSEKRISTIAKQLGLNYQYKALKPTKKKTLEAINMSTFQNKKIAIIGDRILTDIIVGNRCKIHTILVRKINEKGLPIKMNLTLFFERIVSLFIF